MAAGVPLAAGARRRWCGPGGGRGGRGGGCPVRALRATISTVPRTWRGTPQGNIFVADGYGNSRVAKFDKNGKFIKTWGSTGTGPSQFNTLHSIATDAAAATYTWAIAATAAFRCSTTTAPSRRCT